MASTTRVALIFGAGSNIGTALVKGFLGAGYRVATVSRSKPAAPDAGTYPIQADVSDPKAVPGVFAQVAAAGLEFPSVVIWNAANVTPPTETGNPLEVEEGAWDRDIDLMIKSPYLAARAAVRAWREQQQQQQQGPGTRKGTFIMTGNLLPRQILPAPALVTLGVGKSGAYSWLGLADLTFKGEGIRFFFADERTAAGGPVGSKPDGPGHAKIYLRLVEEEELPHYVTFVKGEYKEFP